MKVKKIPSYHIREGGLNPFSIYDTNLIGVVGDLYMNQNTKLNSATSLNGHQQSVSSSSTVSTVQFEHNYGQNPEDPYICDHKYERLQYYPAWCKKIDHLAVPYMEYHSKAGTFLSPCSD